MKTKSDCPTDATLRSYLNSDTEVREEPRTEKHLSECHKCQLRLESLSASDVLWSEAQAVLQNEPEEPASTHPAIQLDYIKSILGPTDDPNMLGRIDTYEIGAVIGHGGTGIVFKALDKKLNRFVAIKVLEPSFASNPSARRRFEREGRAIAAVSHDHVVAIHAVDEYCGLPYIVMQLVAGKSLQQRLDQQGPLETKEVVRIARQIADALDCAHDQGIVHRDVKPANVLLENGVERVRVGDFGLAQVVDDVSLTRSGVIAGTPQYMSPEQTRGEPLDGRSDLFSLGSVMYAMCVGHPPFRAETSLGILHRIATSPLRPVRQLNPDVPVWLEKFTERLLAKSADDRFESAEQVSRYLSDELAYLQQPASEHPPTRPWLETIDAKSTSKQNVILCLATFGLFISVAVAVFLSGSIGKAVPNPGPSSPHHRRSSSDTDLMSLSNSGTPDQLMNLESAVFSPNDSLDDEFERLIRHTELLKTDIETYLNSDFPFETDPTEVKQ